MSVVGPCTCHLLALLVISRNIQISISNILPQGEKCRPDCSSTFLAVLKNVIIRKVVRCLNLSFLCDSFAYANYPQWSNLRGKVKVSALAFRLFIKMKEKILSMNQIKCLLHVFSIFACTSDCRQHP